MLRAVDSLLQIESTQGTPQFLENSDVKPVIDVRMAGMRPPVLVYGTETIDPSGVSESAHSVYTPPENCYSRLLGAQADIIFNAAPVATNRLSSMWNLAPAVPNGSDDLVGLSGNTELNGVTVVIGLQLYRFPFGAGGSQLMGSAPSIFGPGQLLFGQSFFSSGSDPLALIHRANYMTTAIVPVNFPALTSIVYRWYALEYPSGETPF